MGRSRLAYIDFETRSVLDVKKAGAVAYAQHPSTEVMCLAFALADGPVNLWHKYSRFWEGKGKKRTEVIIEESPVPFELLEHIKNGGMVEAHNAGFERAIWENICAPKMFWPSVAVNKWQCSAAKAAAMSLPRALDDVCAVLELPVQKNMEGNRTMLRLAKPRKITKLQKHMWNETKDELEILWGYCITDVECERALSHALPDLTESEREVWLIDQEMNFRGIAVDGDLVQSAIIHQTINVERLTEELNIITGGAVTAPTQRQRFIDWLKSKKVFIENTQAEYLDELLERSKPKNPEQELIYRAVEIIRECGKTSISKYQSFQYRTCKDGRLRDNLMYWGARPGRWAGKGTQLQNLPRGEIKDMVFVCKEIRNEETEMLQLLYGNIPKLLSHTLRGALICSPGKELFVGDYNAIEARSEFWLVDDEEALQIFREGGDIYKEMAATIYRINVEDVTKEQRFIGKQSILGLGYQMWAHKFTDTCLNTGKQFGISVELEFEFAKSVVLTYRAKYPKITGFWTSLQNAAVWAIQNPGQYFRAGKIQFSCGKHFLRMRLPSGRHISYFHPWLEDKETYRGLEKQIRYWGQDPKTHQWTKIDTFGGKLAENATQGHARDLLVHGMKQIQKTKRYDLLLTVHDEVIAEGNPEETELEEFENLMSSVPDYAEGMPIKVEAWKGERYRK